MRNPVLHVAVQKEKILGNATLAELKMAVPGASVWARNPSLCEINTWVWVTEGTQDKSCSFPRLRRLRSSGLSLELGPWNYHLFECLRTNEQQFGTLGAGTTASKYIKTANVRLPRYRGY